MHLIQAHTNKQESCNIDYTLYSSWSGSTEDGVAHEERFAPLKFL